MNLPLLTAENGYIFRITHLSNLQWIIDHGLHARSAEVQDPNFTPIGNKGLIDKRHYRSVPDMERQTLSDYVPFYFTPRSIMLLGLVRGGQSVDKRPVEEVVMLVTRLRFVEEAGIPFCFTDRHAYLNDAQYFSDASELHNLRWDLFQQSDFAHSQEEPDKGSYYQAEALIHQHVPFDLIKGVYVGSEKTLGLVDSMLEQSDASPHTEVKLGWFFS